MSVRVSVVIPAFNSFDSVRRAVDSALAQSYRPAEIIVVDDGSGDRTADSATSYGDIVRLIRKENGGPASARDLGAASAAGEWLAFLDADDWWLPAKLSAELSYALDPDVGLIHCLSSDSSFRKNDSILVSYSDLWERNLIINSSVLLRHVTFSAVGGFDIERDLISVEDYNLWIRVAATHWRIVTCPRRLVHYTRGPGLSSNTERYLKAQIHNIKTLADRLRIDSTMLDAKYRAILLEFGQRAFYERRLHLARRLLWRSLDTRNSMRVSSYLFLCTLPPQILNLKRSLLGQPGLFKNRDIAYPIEQEALGKPRTRSDVRIQGLAKQLGHQRPLKLNTAMQPLLITTIDVEEDFDWSTPFSRSATNVRSMRSQHVAHKVFERFNVKPTYLVDYAVVSQEAGYRPLQELVQAGRCNIGAQLHPWITPPFSESVSLSNSFPGNLPVGVQFTKTYELTTALADRFDVSPRVYRAGRYGIGQLTPAILTRLGYQIDTSTVPHWSFADEGGPDFRFISAAPFWLSPSNTLLEFPISASVVGNAAALPTNVIAPLFRRMTEREALPSILARLGLVERIKITPEGMDIQDSKRLVAAMLKAGQRIFVLTFHSPSLEPGRTPYVRSQTDLGRFLAWLEEFYTFFIEDVRGLSASPLEALAATTADNM
jgi:glycosyltransferase involved in cell wall biosynthesis